MVDRSDAQAVRPAGLALVLTTVPDSSAGETLVGTLLDERLIACGNLVPGILSLYRWEGAIAREREVMIVMKVDPAGVDRLFERIAELHPYSVPELIELPVSGVSEAYRRWALESTKVRHEG